MADHTLDMLRTAIRAMDEVVLPAVDRSHPLALEQATLVMKILQLLEQRLPAWPARLCMELAQQRSLAQALAADAQAVSPALAQALDAATARADALLADPVIQPLPSQQATRELGDLVAALVDAARAADDGLRRRIEAAIVASAARDLRLLRAWFLPQGWEPDPSAVPALAEVLRRGSAVETF